MKFDICSKKSVILETSSKKGFCDVPQHQDLLILSCLGGLICYE